MVSEARTGALSATASGKMGHALISESKFRQLHETALTLQLEARLGNGKRPSWLRGREAMLAGITADLHAQDAVVAPYTGSLEEAVRGRMTTLMDPRTLEERLITTLSEAVADRMRKTGRITVIFSHAALRKGIFEEARSLAIAARLPVLLVEDEPPSGKNGRGAARTWEYPSIPVDARDVIAVYRVAHESIARAREGSGPTHIVGVRWKVAAKNGARPPKGEDPVRHLEHWLTARGLPAQEWRRNVVAKFEANRHGTLIRSIGDSNESAEKRAIA